MDKNNQAIRTLVVDDDRVILMMLQTQLEDLGHQVAAASDGLQAWNILQENKQAFDIILLDREMPRMNGIELVRLIKEDEELSRIPIIMQTGSGDPQQIREGLDAGVFYYLSKPVDQRVLISVLAAAASETQQRKVLDSELSQHKNAFKLIDQCRFIIRNLNEVQDLACFVSNCFPKPERAVLGVAALLTNALEHGNLCIGYELKTQLINNGTWREEIEKRLALAENKHKFVEAIIRRRKNTVSLKITDQGDGFLWTNFIKVDPARALDNHGRGIAIANSFCFDEVTYNTAGNEVTASCSFDKDLEW